MTKKTFRDENPTNKYLINTFIPILNYGPYVDGKNSTRLTMVQPKFPCCIEKGIELRVTNGLGFIKPHEKSGKNIRKKELIQYLQAMDNQIDYNLKQYLKNYSHGLILYVTELEKILGLTSSKTKIIEKMLIAETNKFQRGSENNVEEIKPTQEKTVLNKPKKRNWIPKWLNLLQYKNA